MLSLQNLKVFWGDLPLNPLTVPLTVPNANIFSLFFLNNCFADKIVSPSISSHALKKREHEFPFGISERENRTNFSDVSLLRKFSTETTEKVVFHLLSNRILRKLFVNMVNNRCHIIIFGFGWKPSCFVKIIPVESDLDSSGCKSVTCLFI